MIILLYTPDPNGPSQPTSFELNDGKETFNPIYSFITEIWQSLVKLCSLEMEFTCGYSHPYVIS